MSASAVVKTITPIRPVLMPQTFDQLVRFAELAASTDMVPKDFRGKPGNIMLAVQMGSELGLSPMQSIQSIAVINGRPGIWGDGLIGLCRQSPLCQDIVETIEGEGDARRATCLATRRGASPCSSTFSVADAKKAGLWGKDIWAKYPDRMLQNRARGFALRDAFPDVLRGLKTIEELRDTPPDDFRGTTLEAKPEPPPVKAPPAPPVIETKRTWRQLIDETAGMLAACEDQNAVAAVAGLPAVSRAISQGPGAVKAELNALLAEAYARFAEPESGEVEAVAEPTEDDWIASGGFPGDKPGP